MRKTTKGAHRYFILFFSFLFLGYNQGHSIERRTKLHNKIANHISVPTASAVYFRLNKVGPGETFKFRVTSRSGRVGEATATESNYLGTVTTGFVFLNGDTVTVTQVSGPRVCDIQSTYVIPSAAGTYLVISSNCGTPPPPPPTRYASAVYFRLNKVGPGETFKFRVTSRSGTVGEATATESNYLGTVFTGYVFLTGDTVTVTQISGPRVCDIQSTYVLPTDAGSYLVISPNCGTPPAPAPATSPAVVYFRLNKVEAGETFRFRVKNRSGSKMSEVTATAPNYLGTVVTERVFSTGDTVIISQLDGPRACNLQPFYIIPADIGQDLIVYPNCGTAATPGSPRIGIRINKPPAGKSFTYKLYKKSNNQELSALTITAPDNLGYFPGSFNPGDTVYLFYVPQNQMWSSLGSRPSFIISNRDTIIDVSMGFLVAINLDRIGLNEKFKFELRHTGQPKDTLEVGSGNRGGAYFMKNRFYEGDTLYARQLSGPRVCGMPPFTIMTNNNTFISPQCGAPGRGDSNLYRIGIRIRDHDGGSYGIRVPAGGSLYGQFITVRDSVYDYGRSYYSGDTILVSQFFGNKTVLFAENPVVVGHADIIIDGYIGAIPAKKRLAGTYSGQPGSRIVIKSGANEELTITADANGVKGFRFPKEYAEGENYSISIKTAPPNCNCAIVPAATGTMPVDSTELSIICTQAIELVSRSSDNHTTNTFYEATAPAVGGKGADEGRYVAFVSNGAGLDGSLGKYRQIYWRDVKSGVTKLISRAPDGSEGDNSSFAPSISADGLSVAFESYATNLVPGDNNGVRDVYVWKQGSGISCVSRGGNSESYEPAIAGNGQSVVFSSGASNLTAGVDGNSTINIYRAGVSGGIQLLSMDPKTGKGVGGSAPHISDDGNKIVFCSFSDKLVENDKNSLWDIFLWQQGNPQLKKISLTASGGDRNQGDESSSRVVQASISGNGNYIVYATTATNMVSGDNNKLQDIFICDIGGTGVRRLSVTANNTEGDGDSPIEQGGRVGISYDGKWICYQTNATNLGVAKGNIVLQNTRTGKIIPVTNSSYNTTGRPTISRYAACVVAGCSEKLDTRFTSSGIFKFFTGSQISTNQ